MEAPTNVASAMAQQAISALRATRELLRAVGMS
jgi:hypothetical protein